MLPLLISQPTEIKYTTKTVSKCRHRLPISSSDGSMGRASWARGEITTTSCTRDESVGEYSSEGGSSPRFS
jgi:hypothetical protein